MNDRLIRAAKREKVDRTPVWFMRQAGRFLPEYRELRKKHSILDLCRVPELAAKAAMTAVRALPGLDGAIIFSDILSILEPMGIEIAFVEAEGPKIRNPVASLADAEKLRPVEPERDLPGPLGGLTILRREVAGRAAVIGFAGAPFTLASYLIEGGASKDYRRTKALMSTPAWPVLMKKLADAVTAHLNAQIRAGAQIVQLFDSWAGALSAGDYVRHVQPWSRAILQGVTGAPTIHFSTGTSGFLEHIRDAGGDAIGVDWRPNLAEAWRRIGDRAVQGNLDPVALFDPREVLLQKVDAVLEAAGGRAGHIFNLGHGVLPETPIDNVLAVIERVHR